MRTIELEDDLFEKLEELAIPFLEATPNQVMRRVIHHYLSCSEKNDFSGDKKYRKLIYRRYGKLHHSHYRIPIIQVLRQQGGKASFPVVQEFVYSKVKDKLTEIDFSLTVTGIIRWHDTLRTERQKMIREGILKSGSPRGIWELNPNFDLSTLKPEGDES